MRIITIGGQARHGKDSTASIMKGYFEKQNKKCLIIKNGDYLKFIAKEYNGWDGNKDEIGRTLLQTLGTEEARDNNPDIWVNVLIEFVKAFGRKYDYILIPDFRYPNESTRFTEEGFNVFSVWVHRKNFDNGLTEDQKKHRSETSLLDYKFDHIVSVESKMHKLKDAVENMIVQYKL
jgi:hypothetical protein